MGIWNSLAALALGTVAIVVAGASCTRSTSQQRASSATPCPGTPVLMVHNNTSGDIDVYEYRAGVRTVIATLRPGTHTVPISGEAGVSYGAQPAGGTRVLGTTGRSRARDGVRLEKGCR